MLHPQGDYLRTRDAFTWAVPERYNMARTCATAGPTAVAARP